MNIVIVGGNECMRGRYCKICKRCGCKAKVFTKENGTMKKKLGCPELILFTKTVSHKMAISAVQEAKRNNIPIARIHSSSAATLKNALSQYCLG